MSEEMIKAIKEYKVTWTLNNMKEELEKVSDNVSDIKICLYVIVIGIALIACRVFFK